MICLGVLQLFAVGDSSAARPARKGPVKAVKPGKPAPVVQSSLDKALAALEAKDFPTANRLLTETYRATPRTELFYHLGRLAAAEGRVLDAHDFYRRYLADPARDPDEAATQAADQFVTQTPPPGGFVSVQSDPGAFVIVDSRVVGTLPLLLPLLLTPGDHTVVLEFSNKRLEAPLQVAVGRLTEVRLSRGSGAVVVSVIPAILHYSEWIDVAPAESRVLTDATEQAARGEQYTLLGADLAVGQAAELKECLKELSCQRQLAVKNKSSFVLQESIKKQGDAKQPSWQLSLRLYRVDVEQPAAQSTLQCDNCTLEQAASKLKEATGKILSEGLIRPRGTLQVVTEPPAATIRIGDGAPGQAPYSATLWVGSYELRTSLPGYKADERSVEVTDGKSVEVKIELTKEVASIAPPVVRPKTRAPRPKWRLALGGVMLGIGVGMVAVGAAGIPMDKQCQTPPSNMDDTCPQIYRTLEAGIVSVVNGVVLIGGGVLLMSVKEPLR